ncbi:cytochrome c oxidase assembly protein [Dictyobacter arantiisoli]|uniref:Cytochrome c oxidase assembly protein n=1 Tax=Dictyobacter arantiisoli TaxID=2014874 RepID=A0A5A5TD89_9CHLR|nr:cytochrome c oxidase assembly protein [Dictyobacter arantiisoli]GCF09136.1 hypothetical protein KDI_27000 [Dictyobacter arantiisoli]
MLNGLTLSWSWSLGGFVCMVLLAALYLFGLWRVNLRRRQDPQAPTVHPIRIAAFFVGWLLFALLFFSPIHTIGRTQLFSVHMAEVVTLTTLCAPLLLGGCSAVLLGPALDNRITGSIIRFLTHPVVASVIFNATFLAWHAPKIFNGAMGSAPLYNTMMLTIFLTSLLNWWPIIGSISELKQHGYPLQMLYVVLDGQPVDIFAFLLVFSGVGLYPHYLIPAQMNMSHFADQAVAGAILLIPGLVDLAVMTPLFISWMGLLEQKTRLADERRARARELDDDEEDEDAQINMGQAF